MGLKVAVATPFRMEGKRELVETDFVVALTLDRDWYTPDQAQRLLDRAAGEGLLEREDDTVRATFDPEGVEVPEDFSPDNSLLQERSPFERVLDAIVAAGGDKQSAVATINKLQAELGVSIEAAAVLHARGEGVDVSDVAERALADVRDGAKDGANDANDGTDANDR